MRWIDASSNRVAEASFFSSSSSLRLLAGDTGYWMHRRYRIAMERREATFEPVKDDPHWRPLAELHSAVMAAIPEGERDWYEVRRPHYGGDVWNEDDPVKRREVLNEAIDGAGVVDFLEPVIELFHARRAHEDFSARYSWIKEDFERQSSIRSERHEGGLIETLDDGNRPANAH